MTVTAPIEGTTRENTAPVRVEPTAEPSSWRDPLMPFLILGILSLVAIVVFAYVLTTPAI